MLGDILADAPPSLQARLFAAFGLELIYNKEDHQVSIYATITPSTPATLAEIIAGSEPPRTPAAPANWPFPHSTPECDGCANHDNHPAPRHGQPVTPVAGSTAGTGPGRSPPRSWSHATRGVAEQSPDPGGHAPRLVVEWTADL
jgi:hypothetical protein